MLINNIIDLYDIKITELLKNKLTSVPTANFIYAPTDLSFSFALEKLGKDKIFPLYNIFRNEPFKIENERASYANFRSDYLLTEKIGLNYLNVVLEYQIDFFSNSMRPMNLCNIDYHKFRKDAVLTFDLTPIGLDHFTFDTEIKFEDIESNNSIENMFNTGRYFRFSYIIRLDAIYMDIKEPFEFDTYIYSVYENNFDVGNKLYEKTTIVE